MWDRIHDKHNNGVRLHSIDPELRSWLKFRKVERSNKTVKEDLRKTCQEFDAAFSKGRPWLQTSVWASELKRLKAFSDAVFKLQVLIFNLNPFQC